MINFPCYEEIPEPFFQDLAKRELNKIDLEIGKLICEFLRGMNEPLSHKNQS